MFEVRKSWAMKSQVVDVVTVDVSAGMINFNGKGKITKIEGQDEVLLLCMV